MIKNGVFENDKLSLSMVCAQNAGIRKSGEVQDMCGEDVSFCLDAKEAGL